MAFQTVRLRPDVHLAWIGEDIVVLDVSGDGYACMVGAAHAIRQTDSADLVMVDPSWADGLDAAGLTSLKSAPFERKALRRAQAFAPTSGSSNPLALVRAVCHTATAYALFEQKPFPALVRSANCAVGLGRSYSEDRLSEAVGAFLVTHPWIPLEGDCLKRSFALHFHLRCSGIGTDWVFGVRTWPFLAHSWVQRDSIVIGDSLERISGFTPILAV